MRVRITMWHRALVTALALTYLICVLSLSGVQKEDLDANTLKKLKQHNVNLDDLNNDTLRRDCLASSKVEISSNKQETGAEMVTPTWYPVVTERILHYSKEPQATDFPDIDTFLKYFKTLPIPPAKKPYSNIDDTVLKDEENKHTTIAYTATTITNVTNNNSLLNPENLMKFWSMYANFQQSQKEINKLQKEPSTTTPRAEQRTEKNNIFQITINKYTRNESFLEQYFDNHRNKTTKIKRPDVASNHIMEKIHDFISKNLFANEDGPSKETPTINGHKIMQQNRINKPSQKYKADKTEGANLDTFDKDVTTKTAMRKLPQRTLEDIAKEVQELVLRGLGKLKPQPSVVTPNHDPDVTNDISEKNTDKMSTVLLGSVVDDVKKMLLSELRKDSTFKASVTTSTAKAVTDKDILRSTKKPGNTDQELNTFMKFFKKFKSWKESSSSSSKEDIEAESFKNNLDNSEAKYQSYEIKVRKNKRKPKTIHRHKETSSQLNDSSTNYDPINSHGYPKYHEKNVITEVEEHPTEPDSISVQFPLPYRTIYSKENKPTNIDNSADSSMEQPNLPARNHNPNHRFKNKQARNKVPRRLKKKLNLNIASNFNSFENNNPTKNKVTKNLVKDNLKMAPEYSSNNENIESHDVEALSIENNDNFNAESVSNAKPSLNKDGETFTQNAPTREILKLNKFHKNRRKPLLKNKDTNAGHKIAPTLDGYSNPIAVTEYEKSNYLGQSRIMDAKAANTFSPNTRVERLNKNSNHFGFDEEGNVNLGLGYNSYGAQNNIKNSGVQDHIGRNSNIAPVYSQNASENKVEGNQDFLRNNPNFIYNPARQYKIQESKTLSSGNVPNENQMLTYPYEDPNYSINNIPVESHQPDIPNANTGYNPYGAPNHPPTNNIGGPLVQMRAEVNSPSVTGYLGGPNYSGTKNIGDSHNQIPAGKNPNTPNSMAAYPYATAQYSANNKPGEISDLKISVDVPIQPAAYPYSAPYYPTVTKIEDTQGHIPAAPFNNDNANTGLASPFGGIFGAKVKFPVIQDPRVEELMKNPKVGSSYLPQMYPKDQLTNGQGPMAAFQNPYMRERQDIISPGSVPNTLINANIQGGPLAVQNPYAKQPSPYRQRQDIIPPTMVRPSMTDANLSKQNNVQIESHVSQTIPYLNTQPVVSSAYGKQAIDVPASRLSNANLPKQNVIQTKPIDPQPTKNENTFNTITKIYPPHSTKKEKDNSDQKSPIMIQTNDDEIMPLGIPIQIKGESKFHMRMIQNQHIIVTTTARPKSRSEDWNNYRLSKHTRVSHKTKEPRLAPAAPFHRERVRKPMTHHDFEDITPNQEQSHQSNYYRYEANDMKPKSQTEFDSRHASSKFQYAPESQQENGKHYNPEMHEDRYPRQRFEKPKRVSLFRNQEKMHDSINAGHLTIAQRHQMPLKRPQVNFDDTHFKNFLKTQEKVNEILERILSTRPKNLSFEPFKGDR